MPTWHTLKCDTDTIGQIMVVECDNFHIVGRFRAGADFPRYKAVFEKSYHQWAKNSIHAVDALEKVNDLGLYLQNATSGVITYIRDFQLEGLSGLNLEHGESVEFKFLL